MVEEVRFEMALEQQLTKLRMMHISPPRSSSMSPKLEPCTPTQPERSASGGSDVKKRKDDERATAEVAN